MAKKPSLFSLTALGTDLLQIAEGTRAKAAPAAILKANTGTSQAVRILTTPPTLENSGWVRTYYNNQGQSLAIEKVNPDGSWVVIFSLASGIFDPMVPSTRDLHSTQPGADARWAAFLSTFGFKD
jgi:hypothetical protein